MAAFLRLLAGTADRRGVFLCRSKFEDLNEEVTAYHIQDCLYLFTATKEGEQLKSIARG
ncbi:MAG: hypothetical protein P4M11_03690 [Candidatus Pacebacteria bacterium]|nr:hypothetical protein [Candidatus Paceibacterota bacterium]